MLPSLAAFDAPAAAVQTGQRRLSLSILLGHAGLWNDPAHAAWPSLTDRWPLRMRT
jgi:hypothetical protein